MTAHYEPGKYSATVTRQGFAESSKKGTPYFFVEFEPIEALGANVLPDTIYPRRVDMYLTEKAAPYSLEKMKYLGWDGKRLGDLDPDKPDHTSFVNQIITVVNNPDDFDKFDLVRDGGDVENQAGLADKLDRLYTKQIAAHGNGNGTKATTPKEKANAELSEADGKAVAQGFPPDEIPF